MKKTVLFVVIGAMLLWSGNALALTINFATGQDSSGNIQTAGGSQDANWHAVPWGSSGSAPVYVTVPGDPNWYGGWSGITSPNSNWVAPNPKTNQNGYYDYVYTFDLSGYDIGTAHFNGIRFSLDDGGHVYLNDTYIASNYWGGTTYYFTQISIYPTYLKSGINTLTVKQYDSTDNNLEALRFEGTLTIERAPVPIPGAILLLGPGLAGLAAIRRRLR